MQFTNLNLLAGSRFKFRNLLFGFFCIYFVLFIIPFPVTDDYSWGRFIVNQHAHFWERVTHWFSKNLLNLHIKEKEGRQWGYDTLLSYVGSIVIAVVSTIICIAWIIFDKRKRTFPIIFRWVTTYVRYFLVYNMFGYGLNKIYNLQFGWARFPKLVHLVNPYGNNGPQGLLWEFMAYSNSYQIFAGSVELLGGILMLFKRTAILGILITTAAMSNVVMLNWSYNVEVKYYSVHLLLMAIFLLVPHIKRLADFFILNKATSPSEIHPVIFKPKMKLAFTIFQLILFLPVAWSIYKNYDYRFVKKYAHEPDPPLYGIYKTESFVLNKDTLPPLMTDSIRWRQMIVDRWETDIYFMNEKINYGHAKVDTIRKILTITSGTDSLDKFVLSYSVPGNDKIIFEGKHNNDSLYIRMRKVDINKEFYLVGNKWTWFTDDDR